MRRFRPKIGLKFVLGQYRTNEVVGTRMNFSSDDPAKIAGIVALFQDFCRIHMAEKASRDVPPNCAVLP